MNKELWEQAQTLSNREYSITIEQDVLSNGQKVFLIRHPELPGCKAQGKTMNLAKVNLDEARREYIYALLESGLEVPEPNSLTAPAQSLNGNNALYVFNIAEPEANIETIFEQVIHPDNREQLVNISFIGDLVKHG